MRQFVVFAAVAMALGSAPLAQTVKTPLQVGGDVQAPTLLQHPDVHAPINQGQGDESGEATISIVVDSKGHVAEATLLSSSGSAEFDHNAVLAARKYVFAPAMREGKPVAVQMSIAMNFRTHIR